MAISLSSLSQEMDAISEKPSATIQEISNLWGYFQDPSRPKLMTGVCFMPKENDEDKPYGEDAYFVSGDEQTIGVADGVGGWAECGIDSGVYARQLMGYAYHLVENRNFIIPMNVLSHAFAKTKAEGASTACIITLRDSVLHAANVGDSGFRVIRAGKIVYSSPVQQSYFNCPFQLGGGNTPSDADEIQFEVERGDIIVVASDGLFDNMFDEEMEYLVGDSWDKRASPESMACRLGRMARNASLFDDEVSPFSLAAKKAGAGWGTYLGGKYDDVTVVVGYVY